LDAALAWLVAVELVELVGDVDVSDDVAVEIDVVSEVPLVVDVDVDVDGNTSPVQVGGGVAVHATNARQLIARLEGARPNRTEAGIASREYSIVREHAHRRALGAVLIR